MSEVGERGVAVLGAGPGGDASWHLECDDLPDATNLIAFRGRTHGNYSETAAVAQKVKAIWHDAPNWERLTPRQRESLDNMATKAARILCGNPRCRDHWADIAGYAQLVADDL